MTSSDFLAGVCRARMAAALPGGFSPVRALAASLAALPAVWARPVSAQQEPPASLTGEPARTGGGGLELGWGLNLPDNLYFVFLGVAVVVSVVGAFLHYRAILESKIKEGTHPNKVRWGLYVFWFGVFLIVCFAVLWQADLGIHLAILLLFLLAMVFAAIAGKLLLNLALIAVVVLVGMTVYRHLDTIV